MPVGLHHGVDVSNNQPHPIDWHQVHAALTALGGGAEPFAIVKAIQGGGYINNKFAEDVAAAKAAGFRAVGAYLMDQGGTSPTVEEALYRRVAGSVPQFDDIELPGSLTPGQYRVHVGQLLAAAPAMPYYNQSEENEGFPNPAGCWEANFNKQPGLVHGAHVLIHQYDNIGQVPGIKGPVDLDCWTGLDQLFYTFFHLTSPENPTVNLNADIVASVATATGNGRWDVASDGGVFSFGDATAFSQDPVPGLRLNRPVVAAVRSAGGHGLHLVAGDGGTFELGDAAPIGNIPGLGIGPAPLSPVEH